jgi:hypothetical protein
MATRKVLLTLALGVLMGTFAVVATADAEGMDTYGPWDKSLSAEPESSVGLPETGESRGPMETGAIPEPSGSSSYLSSNGQTGHETVEVGGQVFRVGIDDGP